jgi:hypothetical protein
MLCELFEKPKRGETYQVATRSRSRKTRKTPNKNVGRTGWEAGTRTPMPLRVVHRRRRLMRRITSEELSPRLSL